MTGEPSYRSILPDFQAPERTKGSFSGFNRSFKGLHLWKTEASEHDVGGEDDSEDEYESDVHVEHSSALEHQPPDKEKCDNIIEMYATENRNCTHDNDGKTCAIGHLQDSGGSPYHRHVHQVRRKTVPSRGYAQNHNVYHFAPCL